MVQIKSSLPLSCLREHFLPAETEKIIGNVLKGIYFDMRVYHRFSFCH